MSSFCDPFSFFTSLLVVAIIFRLSIQPWGYVFFHRIYLSPCGVDGEGGSWSFLLKITAVSVVLSWYVATAPINLRISPIGSPIYLLFVALGGLSPCTRVSPLPGSLLKEFPRGWWCDPKETTSPIPNIYSIRRFTAYLLRKPTDAETFEAACTPFVSGGASVSTRIMHPRSSVLLSVFASTEYEVNDGGPRLNLLPISGPIPYVPFSLVMVCPSRLLVQTAPTAATDRLFCRHSFT